MKFFLGAQRIIAVWKFQMDDQLREASIFGDGFPRRQSQALLRESSLAHTNSSQVNPLAEAPQHQQPPKVELKRDLTKLESYAAIIGILVGSGIFVVTGKSATIAGPSIPLAYLVLAPVILVTAVAYSVYISTPLGTSPGGEYLHISRTTG